MILWLILQNSRLLSFERMWQYMSKVEPENMVTKSEQGFDRIRDTGGQYAFLWDSPVVEYRVKRDCDLVEVTYILNEKCLYFFKYYFQNINIFRYLELLENCVSNSSRSKWRKKQLKQFSRTRVNIGNVQWVIEKRKMLTQCLFDVGQASATNIKSPFWSMFLCLLDGIWFVQRCRTVNIGCDLL